MNFLVDTNVISEIMKPDGDRSVLDWLNEYSAGSHVLYLSVVTTAELYRGMEMLPEGRKKRKLKAFIELDLPRDYGDRILSFNPATAIRWGRMMAETRRSLPIMDSLIAATALAHDLTLATRNTKDFDGIPALRLVNPWLKSSENR